MKPRGKNKKIVVGLSGGVDSSTALVLLKEAGWEPIGVSLKLPVWESPDNILRENTCRTAEALATAEKLCKKLGVEFHTIDAKKEFRKEVIEYFNREYRLGRTPNPCALCNRKVKFEELFEFAEKVDADHVATGHYAKTRFNAKTKKYELVRPKDKEKDQTYVLSFLPQEWAAKIIFPLEDCTKKEVLELAKDHGLSRFEEQQESQDFCFTAGKPLTKYLEETVVEKPGKIVDEKGKVVGRHKGIHFYTIGQRRGIKLAGGPYYVKELDLDDNRVVVTKDKQALYSKTAELESVNYISGSPPKQKIKVNAKIRYQHPLSRAVLKPLPQDKAEITFDKPQRAITPGQVCAFYSKDTCLGGGLIEQHHSRQSIANGA